VLGIAEAGMLLWHEKVVRPATAATPSEFRHGLIEAATNRDAVLLVDVAPEPAPPSAYLERLRSELQTLGVGVVELRARASNPGAAALELLLRMQQLARAAALAGGTYRDGFAVLRNTVTPASDLFA
jgi:fructoselysine-6-P-deglycase FrlB-like protein